MIILSFIAAIQVDVLADLTRRSAELKSFRATYELTGSASAGTTQIRLEYVAPARARVERTLGAQHVSTWCVDGVLAMTSTGGESPLEGRVECGPVFDALAPIDQALHSAFPAARARGPRSAGIGMRWDFDAKSQRTSFLIDAQPADEIGSPLGWLQTLRQKSVPAREDGDLLQFESDGPFKITLSKRSAFVEKFSGAGPEGELHLALISLEQDAVVDPERLKLPTPITGAKDVSPDLLRNVQRIADVGLRERIYGAIAGADSPKEWDDAFQQRTASVFRPFYERALPRLLESSMTRWNKIRDTVAERLAGMRKDGKSATEVDAVRQRESGYMNKQLDELEQGFLTRLSVPGSASTLPRAGDLLALEKSALSDAFRSKVRGPVVLDFETATKPD